MWIILLLGGALLYLLRNQEGFEGNGRLKDELIRGYRSRGVPEKDIPKSVDESINKLIETGGSIYRGLKDKSQFPARIDEVLLSEDAIREGGRPLAEAASAFLKQMFSEKPKNTQIGMIKDIRKEAAPVTTGITDLLSQVEDEGIRSMLKKYSELMVEYHTTGELAYKTAADRIMQLFQSHITKLDAKAARDSDKVVEFIRTYDTTNKDVTDLRDELRNIRKQGPKLGDQYETQKKINEELSPEDPQYLLKAGLLVGLFLIGFIAKTYGADTMYGGNYMLKGSLVVGLAVIGYIGFTSFFD